MKTFEPRQVPPSSWRDWLREGVALAKAKWAINLTIAAAAVAVDELLTGAAGALALVATLLPAVAIAALVVTARSADLALDPQKELANRTEGFRTTVTVCALLLVLLALMTFVLFGLPAVLRETAGVGPSYAERAAAAKDLAARYASEHEWSLADWGRGSALWLCVWIWFTGWTLLIPLAVLSGGRVLEVWDASMDATVENPFLLRVSLWAAMLFGVVGLSLGPTALVLYPVAGATLYVAYRHIFLNLPPRKAPRAVPVGAGAKA